MLGEMLSYRRPARSETEEAFIRRYIEPTGATRDAYGNYLLRIGDAPVLWSAHTDTVHRRGGRQRWVVNNGILRLRNQSKRNGSACLGADDTTGVWLLLELIREGVEGLYIFHRDEESGMQGSMWIAKNRPEILTGYNYAIAFDRRGYDSVVTHQCGWRTASDEFADALIEQLGIDHYEPDDTGLFTDTEAYADVIPECTNLSVGYMSPHSSFETQDMDYAYALRDFVVERMRPAELPAVRDPEVFDHKWSKEYKSAYAGSGSGNGKLLASSYDEYCVDCSGWDGDHFAGCPRYDEQYRGKAYPTPIQFCNADPEDYDFCVVCDNLIMPHHDAWWWDGEVVCADCHDVLVTPS